MIKNVALAFSVALASASGQPTSANSDEDKPLFIRAYEHPSPVIQEYRLAGTYGKHRRPFSVALRFKDGQWDLQIERNRELPLIFRFDKAYNAIPVNLITLATNGNDDNLIVRIPFGTAHSDCFANGNEVFSQIVVNGTSGELSVEEFQNCQLAEVSPAVRNSDGVLLVGTSSQQLRDRK